MNWGREKWETLKPLGNALCKRAMRNSPYSLKPDSRRWETMGRPLTPYRQNPWVIYQWLCNSISKSFSLNMRRIYDKDAWPWEAVALVRAALIAPAHFKSLPPGRP